MGAEGAGLVKAVSGLPEPAAGARGWDAGWGLRAGVRAATPLMDQEEHGKLRT